MEFDKVKAEKADAMRKYKRQKYTLFCFKLLVGSILLYSSFSSSLPFVLHKASLYLSLHLRVFLLLNAIVFLVYYSSSSSSSSITNDKQVAPQQPSDLYDEYMSHSSQKQLVVLPPVEETVQDKQIVVCEVTDITVGAKSNNVEITLNERVLTHDLTVDEKVHDLTVVTKCSDVKNEEEKCYRRTKSETYARENIRRSILRRSETEKAMEEMNNEEFRMTIERFIESKKKILRDENMAII